MGSFRGFGVRVWGLGLLLRGSLRDPTRDLFTVTVPGSGLRV